MEEIFKDTAEQLQTQLEELSEKIRSAEEGLMRSKEGYLKVTGALEVLAIVKQRVDDQRYESDGSVDLTMAD